MILSHAIDSGAAIPQNAQQFERQRFLIRTYGRHRAHEIAALGDMIIPLSNCQSLSQILQIGDGGIYARYIFVNKRARFDFSRRLVRNEVLVESWQLLKKFAAPPEKSHVRRKDLITRTYQIITIESLYIDCRVRPIVHTIQKNLGIHSMRELG